MNCENSRDVASPEEADPGKRSGMHLAGPGPQIAPATPSCGGPCGRVVSSMRRDMVTFRGTTLYLVAAGAALLLAMSPVCALGDDSPKNPWDLRLFRFEFDND